jgi:hypothetical protein
MRKTYASSSRTSRTGPVRLNIDLFRWGSRHPGYPKYMRALSPSILSRRDQTTARLVDLAVNAQQKLGTQGAAEMLASSGIPLRLALRILGMPHLRRGGISGQLVDGRV